MLTFIIRKALRRKVLLLVNDVVSVFMGVFIPFHIVIFIHSCRGRRVLQFPSCILFMKINSRTSETEVAVFCVKHLL